MPRIACVLLVLALGCPETEDGDCPTDPLQPTCISACIASANQNACIQIVDACRAQPDVGRCGDLIQACMEMPTAIGCSGDGDAAVDVGVDAPGDSGADAGPCGECSAPTPVCNETTMACVECVGAGDCGGTTPFCSPAGACTECEGHGDCTNAGEARCSDVGMCEPCGDSAECVGTDGTICTGGNCVECNADDETACGANVCDVAAMTCTDTPAEMTSLCTECVSDRQCRPGMVCAPMAFDAMDLGHFCLWRQDATEVGGPMGSCINSRPYRGAVEDVVTLSGVTTTVCGLRNSTCAALADFDAKDCDAPGPAGDAMCGDPALDDGLCREVDAVVNRCTTRCGSDDDCLEGFTCNIGETPRYCNF